MTFSLLFLILSGCEKTIDPTIHTYQITGTFRVPTNLQLAAQHALPASTFFNATDSILLENGYTMDRVNQILIDSIYVTTNDTTVVDLNFLQELDLLLEGGSESKLLIGTTGDLPTTIGDTTGLSSTTRDLKDYLTSDSLLIWPELIIDNSVLTPTTVKVVMDLTIEIGE